MINNVYNKKTMYGRFCHKILISDNHDIFYRLIKNTTQSLSESNIPFKVNLKHKITTRI